MKKKELERLHREVLGMKESERRAENAETERAAEAGKREKEVRRAKAEL